MRNWSLFFASLEIRWFCHLDYFQILRQKCESIDLSFLHKIFFVVAFDHLTSSFCRSSSPVFSSIRLNRLFCRLLRVAGMIITRARVFKTPS